jgi:L-fuconolactonase
MTGLVDSHFHLWRAEALEPSGVLAAPQLQHDVTWEDFEALTKPLGIEQCVFVHAQGAAQASDELTFASELAETHPEVMGFVAWAPLESPDIGDRLQDLVRDPLVCGVRRATQYEPDPEFCLRPDYLAGARLAAAHGLTLDMCVLEHQLEGLRKFAERLPEATIVLEHLGKPPLGAPPTAVWRSRMAELGALPNVYCKLSPTIFGADDAPLDRDLARSFVEHIIESWSWDRLIYGSNWPVSSVVIGYEPWLELLVEITDGVPGSERSKLFTDNARRVYEPRRS